MDLTFRSGGSEVQTRGLGGASTKNRRRVFLSVAFVKQGLRLCFCHLVEVSITQTFVM